MAKDWRAHIAKVKREMKEDLREMALRLELSRRQMAEQYAASSADANHAPTNQPKCVVSR